MEKKITEFCFVWGRGSLYLNKRLKKVIKGMD